MKDTIKKVQFDIGEQWPTVSISVKSLVSSGYRVNCAPHLLQNVEPSTHDTYCKVEFELLSFVLALDSFKDNPTAKKILENHDVLETLEKWVFTARLASTNVVGVGGDNKIFIRSLLR